MSDRRDFLRYIPVAGTTVAAAGMAVQSGVASANVGSSGFSTLVASSEAPQEMQDAADFVCTGSADQNTINQAINAQAGLGGVVALSPGRFNCTGPVRVRSKTLLTGSGRSSVLTATQSWSGALIQANNSSVDKVTICNLALNGRSMDISGILLNVTSNANFEDGSPDAANYLTDVYVYNVRRHGVYITGSRNRAACLTRVRVWQAGGYGFVINSPDGFIHQCESGSSGLDGFRIQSANNRITNCKAWYSDGSGFNIRSVRNELTACESQDNERHGFYIASGQVSLTSCHADSNSWNRDTPVARYFGFCIIPNRSRVQLIGCQAYDKNEGGRGHWQLYGFALQRNNTLCQISGIGRDNVQGALYQGSGVSNNSIDILGD
ncbi:MAG: right-handed parallel beta-helix repeat-containing protein [Granulosicoccus sp.]